MSAPALICLPPAGGGPGLFRDWQRDDPGVIAPSLPGREAWFREAMVGSLAMLADLLAGELAPTLPRSYALFGYSMGGTIAVLLAQRLVARGFPHPQALFTLGALAPDRLNSGISQIHTLSSADFWDEIAKLGGTPEEILADPDLRALFEPTLRADFALCHQHEHGPARFRLNCPVHVHVAREDPLVGPDSVKDWAAFTSDTARLHTLDGGHMLDSETFRTLRPRLRALSRSMTRAAGVSP